MPVWLVRSVGSDDDREVVESWKVNAPTAAEAVAEVGALAASRGQRLEAKLIGEEDAATLPPGHAIRVG